MELSDTTVQNVLMLGFLNIWTRFKTKCPRTSLAVQGAQSQYLVRELRSHMPFSEATHTHTNTTNIPKETQKNYYNEKKKEK